MDVWEKRSRGVAVIQETDLSPFIPALLPNTTMCRVRLGANTTASGCPSFCPFASFLSFAALSPPPTTCPVGRCGSSQRHDATPVDLPVVVLLPYNIYCSESKPIGAGSPEAGPSWFTSDCASGIPSGVRGELFGPEEKSPRLRLTAPPPWHLVKVLRARVDGQVPPEG